VVTQQTIGFLCRWVGRKRGSGGDGDSGGCRDVPAARHAAPPRALAASTCRVAMEQLADLYVLNQEEVPAIGATS
jgi:hypothetical protein